MRNLPERPFILLSCYAMIRAAAVIVPRDGQPLTRQAWADQWRSRVFSRWDFLAQTGLWSAREAFSLFFSTLLAFPNAAWQVAIQEGFQRHFRRLIQSPVSCLAMLAVLLTVIAGLSGGLPATRDLIFKNYDSGGGRLAFAWLHSLRGEGDRPLPSDVVPSWSKHGTLIQGAAAFRASHLPVILPDGQHASPLVVFSDAGFFKVMNIQPAVGALPKAKGVVLSYGAWSKLFHADPRVLGSKVVIDRQVFSVGAVLPPHAEPLTRQPVLYLLIPGFNHGDVFAALRVKDGVSSKQLSGELNKILEDYTFYFLPGLLRYSFAQSSILTPLWSFAGAALASGALLLAVFRIKWIVFFQAPRQAAFFCGKTVLALVCVFTGCLEWSRSSSAILFGTFDPASGPFLLWLYIAGTMGVFFWTVMDQRARCRECLRLLTFPVRIGSPGSMLLDWSGTEFCCSQGHGILHVHHLAPSWSDGPDQWISLDDSWQSLFQDERRKD